MGDPVTRDGWPDPAPDPYDEPYEPWAREPEEGNPRYQFWRRWFRTQAIEDDDGDPD